MNLQAIKIGLALGSGGAWGLAHIGVLEVLEEEGIPIQMVAGTSAGALVGALFAQGKTATEIKNIALDMDWVKMASLIDLSLFKNGFILGRRVTELLRTTIGGNIQFNDLQKPFACVATDIDTCEEVVIKEGSVLEAVRASISLPVIFTPVKWEGRYLVEGGLVNPVPVSVVKEMGANFIIAVNVMPDMSQRTHKAGKKRRKIFNEPNIFSVMIQTMHIASCALVRFCLEGADITIQPRAVIGFGDFHRAKEAIVQGEIAAQTAIAEIKRQLQATKVQGG